MTCPMLSTSCVDSCDTHNVYIYVFSNSKKKRKRKRKHNHYNDWKLFHLILKTINFTHTYTYKYDTYVRVYLYYYIKQLRIGWSIFCHDIFLLYLFYPSIRWIISIFDWSNVCNRIHWFPSFSPFLFHLYYYFHLCTWFTN
jgi:hypothetical protein